MLFRSANPRDADQVMGRTRTNRLTFFPAQRPDGRAIVPGDLVQVRIDTVRSFSLSGTVL